VDYSAILQWNKHLGLPRCEIIGATSCYPNVD
jgi:hypothetical protein